MFVIVRHGNTFETGEPPRRIGARTDLPLTARGIEQATALGHHFAAQGLCFSRVLVSPLVRTRQSAEAILAAQPSPPPVAEEAAFLREIDHGPDENAGEDAVRQRIGTDALAAWENHGLPPQGWDVDAEPRMAAWRDLFAQEADANGPVLLVTSNGAARFALLADADLARAARTLASLKLPTGGYGIISRFANGSPQLRAWGLRP